MPDLVSVFVSEVVELTLDQVIAALRAHGVRVSLYKKILPPTIESRLKPDNPPKSLVKTWIKFGRVLNFPPRVFLHPTHFEYLVAVLSGDVESAGALGHPLVCKVISGN